MMMMMRKRVLGFNDLEFRCVSDGGGFIRWVILWPAWCFICSHNKTLLLLLPSDIYAHIYTHTHQHVHTQRSYIYLFFFFEAARELQLFSFGAEKGKGVHFHSGAGRGKGSSLVGRKLLRGVRTGGFHYL